MGLYILGIRKADRIIKNYTECVGSLNELFGLLFDDVCVPCIENKKISSAYGCCIKGVTTTVRGPASKKIEKIKSRLKKGFISRGGEIVEDACEYLGRSTGCIIKDLKPPKCAYPYCKHLMLEEKYSIVYDQKRIKRDLVAILEKPDKETARTLKEYIGSMISKVRSVKLADQDDSSRG